MSDAAPTGVVIATGRSPLEAEAIAAIVRDAGMAATVVDPSAGGAGMVALTRGARAVVCVAPGDAVAARAALDERRRSAGALEWEDVDVGERVDAVPLRRPGRMPLAARLALAVAIALVLLTIIGTIVVLAW